MESTRAIEKPNGRKGVPKPPRKDGFAGGKVDPRVANAKANAARWGNDRRAVVELAKQHRPEAFAVIVELMRKADRDSVRKDCAELVLAYSDGKPRQQLDLNVNAPRDVSSLSTVELEAIARGAPPPFQLTHQGVVIDASALESVP